MPVATLLSRAQNKHLEFRKLKACGLSPTTAPAAGRELTLHRLNPKASELGTQAQSRVGPGHGRCGRLCSHLGTSASALCSAAGSPVATSWGDTGRFLSGEKALETLHSGQHERSCPLPSHPHVEAHWVSEHHLSVSPGLANCVKWDG